MTGTTPSGDSPSRGGSVNEYDTIELDFEERRGRDATEASRRSKQAGGGGQGLLPWRVRARTKRTRPAPACKCALPDAMDNFYQHVTSRVVNPKKISWRGKPETRSPNSKTTPVTLTPNPNPEPVTLTLIHAWFSSDYSSRPRPNAIRHFMRIIIRAHSLKALPPYLRTSILFYWLRPSLLKNTCVSLCVCVCVRLYYQVSLLHLLLVTLIGYPLEYGWI